MQCVVSTTNPVRLTYLQSLLEGADIPFLVFDQHIAALEGGITCRERFHRFWQVA